MNLYYTWPGSVLKYGKTDRMVYVLINIFKLNDDNTEYNINEIWGCTRHDWYGKKSDMTVVY